ncbi:hypothetical protein [Rufibacter psychrotolerans]|uniref:hypothetical protein n=1 Tax=Rufibacter psychrotolerans TaxID=2812556 RepID=UPI00196817A1|nr:hypothetical protein [Rufibacter sp. SYSU D00308]
MQVKDKLKKYYQYYQELKAQGGPEENTRLFEAVIELEEEIMAAYGIPPTHDHLQILWLFTEAPELSPEVLQEAQAHLQQAATAHLTAPVKTNLEVLLEAREEKQSAFNVLPEIGQPTHDYPIFLYEELLLKGKATPEAVLQEMETVKELDCYSEVATLLYQHRKSFRRTKIYKTLKPQLHFLDLYLQQLRTLGESGEGSTFVSAMVAQAEAEEVRQASAGNPKGIDPATYTPTSVLLTDPVEIEEIVYDEDTAVTVNGTLHAAPEAKSISLGFAMEELVALLSNYPDQGKLVLELFQQIAQKRLPDSPHVIDLRDSTGSTLTVDQHFFKVYKPLVVDEEGRHQIMQEEFYLVEEVIDKAAAHEAQEDTTKASLQGILTQILQRYHVYVGLLYEGADEQEARQQSGLGDSTLFELAKILYSLEKHGS